MTTPILPMLTFLEDAKQRLEVAPDAVVLEANYRYFAGVLRGYYLAGAVSEVEYINARRDLQLVYESRKAMFDLNAEWQRREGERS